MLDKGHGELLVGYAVSCVAHVLGFAMGYVGVNTQEHIFEAFGRIVHEAQLEALLVEETFSQSSSQGVRGQGALLRELQLGEQLLEGKTLVRYGG